jgi:hypothetical protein
MKHKKVLAGMMYETLYKCPGWVSQVITNARGPWRTSCGKIISKDTDVLRYAQ